MIIGAYRKYQVKLYLCRAFGEVANHTSRWVAQANLKTRAQKRQQQQKANQKKSKQTTEKVILKKIRRAKKHDFVIIVALCNKIVTLCNTCRTL